MTVYFGLVLIVVCLGLGAISLYVAKDSLVDTVELTLPEVAVQASNAVEEGIESKINALEQMAANAVIKDEYVSFEEKVKILNEEVRRSGHRQMGISNKSGLLKLTGGTEVDIKDREYFKKVLSGKSNVTDPTISKDDGEMIVIYAVPIQNNGEITGALVALRDGNELSTFTNEIKFGNTGQAFMLNKNGTTIAHNNKDLVLNQVCIIENAKNDSSLKTLAAIHEKMAAGERSAGEYEYKGTYKYIGYAPVKSTEWSIGIVVEKGEVLNELNTLTLYIIVGSLVFLTIGICIVLFISGSISKGIKASVEHLKLLASGDFTFEIPKKQLKREDELGQMAQGLNGMQSSITSMIQTIKDSSSNIDAQSDNVSAVAQEMSASSENVSAAIQDVAQGTGSQAADLVDITGILNDFSEKLEEMIYSIKDVDLSTEEIKNMADGSNADMENVIKSVQNVSKAFNDLISKIGDVGQNVKRINEITNLINIISEQTNLLALNAAIEAARAGEAGKGFSVVAEEIRKLAEQSKDSSQNIAALIGEISSDTELMVKTTDIMKSELENQKNDIDTAIVSFGKITNAVDEIRPKINGVNDSAEEIDKSKGIILEKVEGASAIAEEVSASSEEIAASSEEMNASTEELAGSAEVLSNMTKNMMEHVNKFKI